MSTALVLLILAQAPQPAFVQPREPAPCRLKGADGQVLPRAGNSDDTCEQVEFFRRDCAKLARTRPGQWESHCPPPVPDPRSVLSSGLDEGVWHGRKHHASPVHWHSGVRVVAGVQRRPPAHGPLSQKRARAHQAKRSAQAQAGHLGRKR
jgi:hypothetical protein